MLKDDFTHFRFVYFLQQKSEVVNRVQKFVRLAQNNGHHIRTFRSDNGTEFVNSELKSFFDANGFVHQRTIPYNPEQNGGAEREMRTIVEAARSMIHSRNLHLSLWAEAVNTAVHVLNATGTSTVADKTPFELWNGRKANIEHMKSFGVDVYIHIPK